MRSLLVDPPLFGSCGRGLEGFEVEWQTPSGQSSRPRCNWGGFTWHGGARGIGGEEESCGGRGVGDMEGVSERGINPSRGGRF